MLVDGVLVDNDVLDDRAEFLVTTLLQPGGDTSVVEIADGQFLIIEQQRHQLVDIVGYQVLVRVHDDRLVLQERRTEVHLRALAFKPLLHLVIAPTIQGVDNGHSLYNHPDTLRQLIQMRQTTFILLAHHYTLIAAHRVTTQPESHQRDTQRIEICRRRDLHHAVNHIGIHFWRGIDGGTGLRRTMCLSVILHQTGDSEIAQHHLRMLLIAEEEIAGLDILVQNVVAVYIG